ncbi:MAG: ribosome-associated translation inhibitor RaiA, partial [Holdemanella sp.]|nr:ribosome-associated translation inhibitor RaiA [Holdemanella sp.]
MKINIVGKNISITEDIQEKLEKKLNRLHKYFIIADEDVAHVLIRTYPTKQKIEVTIPTKHAILRAEVVDDDLNNAIDKTIDKLEDQIRKQKTRLQKKNKEGLSEAFLDSELFTPADYDPDDDEVVKTKT